MTSPLMNVLPPATMDQNGLVGTFLSALAHGFMATATSTATLTIVSTLIMAIPAHGQVVAKKPSHPSVSTMPTSKETNNGMGAATNLNLSINPHSTEAKREQIGEARDRSR
ncbi:MAG: hypothetical protein WA789_02885 [Candidatus Acidiferrum sp.]